MKTTSYLLTTHSELSPTNRRKTTRKSDADFYFLELSVRQFLCFERIIATHIFAHRPYRPETRAWSEKEELRFRFDTFFQRAIKVVALLQTEFFADMGAVTIDIGFGFPQNRTNLGTSSLENILVS